jgi:hypothetical protein
LQTQPDRDKQEREPIGPDVFTRPRKLPWVIGALALAALIAGAGWRIRHLSNDPQVYFLFNDPGAEWIRADGPFSLFVYPFAVRETIFQCSFTIPEPVDDARLILRAFTSGSVTIDGTVIARRKEETDEWKIPRAALFPRHLAAGPHVLKVTVSNVASHPCLWAHCQKLGIATGGHGWEASTLSGPFAPAVPVTVIRSPDVAREYPSVSATFREIAPWLAGIFCVSLVWTLWNSRPAGPAVRRSGGLASPSRVRWLLLAGWVVLAVNNMWRVPRDMGFDIQQHYEYVDFISHYHRLPLATDGWQMFQPPLFYLAAVPWYSLCKMFLDGETVVKLMRFLPLLCGLAQIEIVYRAARVVFPHKDDLQIVATTVGGLLPMQIYIAQVFGNEPLAGCLTAALILLCFQLLVEPTKQRSFRFFLGLGVLWGLAVLSKLTPVLLAPLVAATAIWQGRAETPRLAPESDREQNHKALMRTDPGTWGAGLIRFGIVVAACSVTAGWFFIRNSIYLGKPVIFGGTPESGFLWWQDPGYRTWKQLTAFGTSFWHPVYSGTRGVWDSLYSSMWLDGSVSGTVATPSSIPWNLSWLESGSWLALVPMGLMLAGLFSIWRKDMLRSRTAMLFAIAAILTYLAAILDLYVRLPIYSTAKATYMVGLVPCFALLAAAGASPFLRYRLLRAVVLSSLACWAVAAYVAYFVV